MTDCEPLQIVSDAQGTPHATGWLPRPAAVNALLRRLEAEGKPPTFEDAAPALLAIYGADEAPVFLWDAEAKVLGGVRPSWDQGQVGTCVSFGFGRGTQDLILNEIMTGEPEQWPGAEVATEPIYGGSRVEVGGGGINGDGSVGAWAADWVRKWGILIRKVYSIGGRTHDLTRYSESLSRSWGNSGVPNELEPEARLHPVREVALVTTAEGLWAAMGARKPVPVCSGQGFTMQRDRDGYCARSGTWNHCMLYRGRFVHPRRGKSVIEQNSWGSYLGSSNSTVEYVKADGTVGTFTLPDGCFAVELTVAAQALAERDTFALAGMSGWVGPVPPVPPDPGPIPGPETTVKGMGISLAFSGWTNGNKPGSVANVTGTAKITAAAEPPPESTEQFMASITIPVPDQPVEVFGVKLGKVPAHVLKGTTNDLPNAVGAFDLTSLLRRLCQFGPNLPEPLNHAAALACYFLPPGPVAAELKGLNLRDVIRLVCPYVHLIPAPVGPILSLVCRFAQSPKESAPCSGC